MSKLTFTTVPARKGSTTKQINVDVDGVPFGALWTFKGKGETHPWHAKPLNGEHRTFYAVDGGLNAAKVYMEKEAGV